jgi:hypothetical protein
VFRGRRGSAGRLHLDRFRQLPDLGADAFLGQAGDDPSATPFVLTAIGLALTVAGPRLASNPLAEPNYDVMLAALVVELG